MAKDWVVSERVALIGLALPCLMLLRASVLFAENDGQVHANYRLRRDLAFYAGERQLEEGNSPEMDKVEVRFRGSEDDQGRNGTVLVVEETKRQS